MEFGPRALGARSIIADSRSETLMFNCCHSWSASLPVLNLSEDRPVSEEISLVINWIEDIWRFVKFMVSKFDTGHSKWTEIIKIYEKVVSKICQSKIRRSTSQW